MIKITKKAIDSSTDTDQDAIHKNVAGEIASIPEKATTVDADIVIIEDSADAFKKKKSPVSSFLTTTDEDAIHKNVAGEIASIPEKVTPVGDDLLITEDSEDSNEKKGIKMSNLPFTGGTVSDGANVGTEGEGLYYQVVGDQMQFYNVAAGSDKVSVTKVGRNIKIDTQPVVVSRATTALLTIREVSGTVVINEGQPSTLLNFQMPAVGSSEVGLFSTFIVTYNNRDIQLTPSFLNGFVLDNDVLPPGKPIMIENADYADMIELRILVMNADYVWANQFKRGGWRALQEGIVIGGKDGSASHDDCSLYNVITDTWRSGADDPAGDRDSSGSGSSQNSTVVEGGKTFAGTAVVDTTLYTSFSESNHDFWITGANRPLNMYSPAGTSDDSITEYFSFGGRTAPLSAQVNSYKYNINTDIWTQIAGILFTGKSDSCAKHISSTLSCFLFGGGNSVGNATSINYQYVIALDAWNQKTLMNVSRIGAGAEEDDGDIYVYTGYSGACLPQVSIYNVSGDSWSWGVAMTGTARKNCATYKVEDRLVATSGLNTANEYLAGSEIFNLTTQTWSVGSTPVYLARGFSAGGVG